MTLNIVGGSTETYDNNGAWYPISDSVIVQTPQSCYTGNTLNVVAAVSPVPPTKIPQSLIHLGPKHRRYPCPLERDTKSSCGRRISNSITSPSLVEFHSYDDRKNFSGAIYFVQWKLHSQLRNWHEIRSCQWHSCRHIQGCDRSGSNLPVFGNAEQFCNFLQHIIY